MTERGEVTREFLEEAAKLLRSAEAEASFKAKDTQSTLRCRLRNIKSIATYLADATEKMLKAND